MILHLAHAKNADTTALTECLKYVDKSDTVVILLDGGNEQARNYMKTLCADQEISVCFLQACSKTENKENSSSTISYSTFVDLCCSCQKIQSWY